jgi:hypothetical protein
MFAADDDGTRGASCPGWPSLKIGAIASRSLRKSPPVMFPFPVSLHSTANCDQGAINSL